MAKVDAFANQEVSSGPLAAMLGKSPQWIRMLTKDGVLQKTPNGKYKLGETVHAYIAYVTGEAQDEKGPKKSEIEREIAEIKRDESRIRLQTLQGEVHTAEDVTAIMGDMITTARQKVLGIASRMAPKLANEPAAVIEQRLREELTAALSALTAYDPALFEGKGGDLDAGYGSEEDA